MEKTADVKGAVEYAESTRSVDSPHATANGGNNNLKRRLGNRQVRNCSDSSGRQRGETPLLRWRLMQAFK